METVLETLCRGLVKKNHQVSVFCYHSKAENRNERIDGVDVHRFATYGQMFSQPISPSLLLRIKKEAKNFDVVHYHSPNPLAEALTFSLSSKIPMVVTYHSDIVRQKVLGALYSPVLNSFLRRMSRIIVASKPAIEHSPFLSKTPESCRVIPFGIDEDSFKQTGDVKKKIEEIKKTYGEYLLFVGRLVSYKGVDVLLEAMKNIDSKLLVVGKGPLSHELRETAKNYNLLNKVTFLENVDSHLELLALYGGCTAFVLPSTTRAEAFGMVLLEAMACGKPVITTRLASGVSYVNQHGVSGLQVEPGDSVQLSLAINRVLKDNHLRRDLSIGARKRFEENFTMNCMVDRYIETYREAIEDSLS